jgi:hypothetical protein
MKERLSYPLLLEQKPPGLGLDMEAMVESPNSADVILREDLPASHPREAGKRPYSISKMQHFHSRVKSIMLIIPHRYQGALG